MREIKFRFWSGTKMFYDVENVLECLKQQISFDNKIHGLVRYNHVGNGGAFLQFTGFQDVTGENIYEGDIMELDKSIYYISFNNGSFCMTQKYTNSIYNFTFSEFDVEEKKKIKIIGNIYENPDLIEASK